MAPFRIGVAAKFLFKIRSFWTKKLYFLCYGLYSLHQKWDTFFKFRAFASAVPQWLNCIIIGRFLGRDARRYQSKVTLAVNIEYIVRVYEIIITPVFHSIFMIVWRLQENRVPSRTDVAAQFIHEKVSLRLIRIASLRFWNPWTASVLGFRFLAWLLDPVLRSITPGYIELGGIGGPKRHTSSFLSSTLGGGTMGNNGINWSKSGCSTVNREDSSEELDKESGNALSSELIFAKGGSDFCPSSQSATQS